MQTNLAEAIQLTEQLNPTAVDDLTVDAILRQRAPYIGRLPYAPAPARRRTLAVFRDNHSGQFRPFRIY